MEEKTVYALGFFDGVHAGHGKLLQSCGSLAKTLGCQSGAVTFATHPDGLVTGKTPPLINTRKDREGLMKQLYGIQHILCLPFDKALMTMHYMTFFRMLLSKYQAAGLVCGEDFRFGNRGEGTAALLQAACEEAKLPCVVVPQLKLEGITVSSTYIRTLLEQGEMEKANQFLDHPHRFSGVVVPGQRLGRRLGVPTANLVLPSALVCPRRGVYVCKAIVDGIAMPAVTNVGCRPTVGGGNVTVEAWILESCGDLYGKEITLEFYAFLRPERKFPSLESLKAEIQENARQTLDFFRN